MQAPSGALIALCHPLSEPLNVSTVSIPTTPETGTSCSSAFHPTVTTQIPTAAVPTHIIGNPSDLPVVNTTLSNFSLPTDGSLYVTAIPHSLNSPANRSIRSHG